MAISKILLSALQHVKHPYGLYTKKQAVQKSITIGKELVDAAKQETPITKDLIYKVIKKHVPEADVKIIQEREEFHNILKAAGENPSEIEKALTNYIAVHFNLRGKYKGIYIPNLKTPEDMSNLAHEIEHYLYNSHTPKRKTFLYIIRMMRKFKPHKTNTAQLKNKNTLENTLRKLFGVPYLKSPDCLKGVKPTRESVDEFLKGNNFTGLTDKKRVNAYIRTVIRHFLPPDARFSPKRLAIIKNTLDDETRAYKVSDIVSRYATGSSDITWQGFVSDIYSRTCNILKLEISNAIKYKLNKKFNPNCRYKYQSGLPATSYCGPKTV